MLIRMNIVTTGNTERSVELASTMYGNEFMKATQLPASFQG
jgi:hypothetical protein